jgi:hypothetical protein
MLQVHPVALDVFVTQYNPEDGSDLFLLESWHISTKLHGITSQKTVILIILCILSVSAF